MVHGGMTLVKYLLFLFNFVFWLTGLALVVAGTVIQLKYREYVDFLDNDLLSAPILLVIMGCIITILGFFGCCGAIRENYCMIMTYAVLLCVLFVLELAAGIASYVMSEKVEEVIQKHMENGLKNFNQTTHGGVTITWNNMQKHFKCCGVRGYEDWARANVYENTDAVPDSCCRTVKQGCGYDMRDQDVAVDVRNQTIHMHGCVKGMRMWVEDNVALVGGIGVGVAFVQAIGAILACMYGRGMSKSEYQDI